MVIHGEWRKEAIGKVFHFNLDPYMFFSQQMYFRILILLYVWFKKIVGIEVGTWFTYLGRFSLQVLKRKKKKSVFFVKYCASEFFFKFKSTSSDFFYKKGVTEPCISLYNICLLIWHWIYRQYFHFFFPSY